MYIKNKDRKRIEKIAEALLNKFGIRHARNSLDGICAKLGIEVIRAKQEDDVCFMICMGGQSSSTKIYLDNRTDEFSQKTHLGRALGHIVLNHNSMFVKDRYMNQDADTLNQVKKTEARYFKQCILLPTNELVHTLRQGVTAGLQGENLLCGVAKHLDVSRDFVKRRVDMEEIKLPAPKPAPTGPRHG